MKTNLKNGTAESPPLDECVACGAEDSYVRGATRGKKSLRGEDFTVAHHHWQCRACGVAVLGDAEMDEAMRATVAAYQEAHDLLTASQIRAARKRLKWSQRNLAARCGLGIATIKRLEGGAVVQTEANDTCLREVLGPALNGCFVFMVTHHYNVSTAWMTEEWNEGWQPETTVARHTVAPDFAFGELCPCS